MPRNLCFARKLMRVWMLVVTVILATTTAQAYTIVLRGGKTVDVSNIVAVTSRTLTYEVASGFQVTLQLAAIDIPATERANGEAPGSFQTRFQKSLLQPVEQQAVKPKAQERTITNRDLESFERKRREGEIAYELRRKELGLPSAEESRQKAIAENASLRERFEQQQLEQRENEAVWRERALNLRSEIAATDAEINSTRQQLDWLPSNNLGVVGGFGPFLGAGFSRVNPSLFAPNVPRVFVTPQIGPAIVGRFRGGFPSAHVFGGSFPQRRFHRGVGQFAGFFPGFVAAPDLSYERTALLTRLNELVARRAGLAARWRALEEDARRSGAMPGWLRP